MDNEQDKTYGLAVDTLKLILGLFILVSAAFIGWFMLYHGQGISDDISAWANFGDYFGGLMNPFVAGAALFLLAKSLIIQHKELSDTREALTKASDSQAVQVKMAARQTKIEIYKMEFDRINTDLQAELTYQQYLIEVSGQKGKQSNVINLKLNTTTLERSLEQSGKTIEELRIQQKRLISKAEGLSL